MTLKKPEKKMVVPMKIMEKAVHRKHLHEGTNWTASMSMR